MCNSGILKKVITAATQLNQMIAHQQLATGNEFGFEGWHVPRSTLGQISLACSWSQEFKGCVYERWTRHLKGQHTSCLEKERYGVTSITLTFYTHGVFFDFVDISIIRVEAICHLNTWNYPQAAVICLESRSTRKQLVSQLSACIWTPENRGPSLLNSITPVTTTAIFIWNPLN